eukprot:GHRR01030098.1.p1 GENE.GHRR01030098.1~~GHRR01030098.1.p1  ORF type:complete len:391 (+),score=127.16 GHRR01030098.1:664-1836(+)
MADPTAARTWLNSEDQLGIKTQYPYAFRTILGDTSIAMVQNPELHQRLRQIMLPYFTTDAIQRLVPDIQATVQKHLARWAAADKPVSAYKGAKKLTFDVMANHALQLGLSDAEVDEYSEVYKTMVDGFKPPAINLPFTAFGKGLKARQQLVQRAEAALSNPDIPPGGLLARFRDEWGPTSDTATNNIINLLFAGHDTTSSAITYMLWLLGTHHEVMNKLREEHAAVQAKYGQRHIPSLAAVPYTAAVLKETLRMSQIIGAIPRVATQPLQTPGAPTVPSGCPFAVVLFAMSDSDPAVAADKQSFRPERWLDPANARSLAQHQMPFGVGQHYCIGSNLAQAEMTAFVAQIALHYSIEVESNTKWNAFPLLQPDNGLPTRLQQLSSASTWSA